MQSVYIKYSLARSVFFFSCNILCKLSRLWLYCMSAKQALYCMTAKKEVMYLIRQVQQFWIQIMVRMIGSIPLLLRAFIIILLVSGVSHLNFKVFCFFFQVHTFVTQKLQLKVTSHHTPLYCYVKSKVVQETCCYLGVDNSFCHHKQRPCV